MLLIIDDAAGRLAATERGIATVGTLGVLRAASHLNMIDLPAALNRLSNTNFRVPRRLLEDLVSEDRESRSRE
ncbi:MAG TPA: hypothetical protein VEX68_29150 [Bryobacteraceae bacterium]|nr:hypothetical protein [Bryobacteraceae bacterium]